MLAARKSMSSHSDQVAGLSSLFVTMHWIVTIHGSLLFILVVSPYSNGLVKQHELPRHPATGQRVFCYSLSLWFSYLDYCFDKGGLESEQ